MKSKQKAENNRDKVGECREAITIRADEPLPHQAALRPFKAYRTAWPERWPRGLIMDLQDDGLLNNSFSGRM